MELPVSAFDKLDTFLAHVRQTKYCWEWMGATTRDGYGTFNTGGKTSGGSALLVATHKFSFLVHNKIRSVPKGYHVMHKCDTDSNLANYRRCVNPNHLRSGTAQENLRDAQAKGRSRAGSRPGVPRTVLNPEAVQKIRRLLQSGLFSMRQIARHYKVHPKTIANIKKRVSHKNIT